MIRKIIKIDEDKCVGCGLCTKACQEGAIGLVDGKAKLLRDDYCDGLGNCLPVCPTGAISFEEREALAYDEKAVEEKKKAEAASCNGGGCPGKAAKTLQTEPAGGCPGSMSKTLPLRAQQVQPKTDNSQSELRQWPVQLKLAPVKADFYTDAKLLVAADCSAYAMGNFHDQFMKGKVTLIGCPKLDAGDYSEKLAAILMENDVKSLQLVRMEVPCCSGLEKAVREAMRISGKIIPWQITVLSTSGEILDQS